MESQDITLFSHVFCKKLDLRIKIPIETYVKKVKFHNYVIVHTTRLTGIVVHTTWLTGIVVHTATLTGIGVHATG